MCKVCRGSRHLAGSLPNLFAKEEPLSAHFALHRKPRILLGVSGSVAAIKVPILAKLLAEVADVQIITTDASRKILSDEDLAALNVPVKGEI